MASSCKLSADALSTDKLQHKSPQHAESCRSCLRWDIATACLRKRLHGAPRKSVWPVLLLLLTCLVLDSGLGHHCCALRRYQATIRAPRRPRGERPIAACRSVRPAAYAALLWQQLEASRAASVSADTAQLSCRGSFSPGSAARVCIQAESPCSEAQGTSAASSGCTESLTGHLLVQQLIHHQCSSS